MALGDFTAIKSIVTLSSATKTVWEASNPILPVGYPAWETDTEKMKIGDGVTAYTGLGYSIDQSLTPEQRTLLDNAGSANGVSVLDANGLVPLNTLPDKAKTHITYVADITARDAYPTTNRYTLFVVLDASADPTVDSGCAVYAWNESSDPDEWVKLSEFESMDIDFSVFFNKTTETLDDIADGVSYVRFTPAERTKLAKAMVTDATYVFAGISPAELLIALS